MRRWMPFPVLTATLLAVWLILNESVTPGGILLGGVLSMIAVRMLLALDPPKGRIRRVQVAVKLVFLVLGDIIRSNRTVAEIILRPDSGKRTAGFLLIPLDMRAPYGLAALACIITATPGTIWVEYDSVKHTILLHILDLVEEQVWIDTIKDRYEKRLMEVFE
ncbi:multisubunit potassium/proton antiporter, PhaE subunit [Azospirillum lipoferum]|nr:multisubunit potassium/proton antiporter, PhaE subunit [Azospirillum lipoferum]